SQPNVGNVPSNLYQLRSRRLVSTTPSSRIRIQQFIHGINKNDPILRELWLPPKNHLAKRPRTKKPRIQNIWTLAEIHPPKSSQKPRGNKGMDEQILRQRKTTHTAT